MRTRKPAHGKQMPLSQEKGQDELPDAKTSPQKAKAANAGSAGVPPALRGRECVLSPYARVPAGRERAGETPALPARTPQQILDIP